MKKPLLTALSVCLLLLVWQFAAWQIQNANLFPPVSLLLRTLGELLLSPSFYQAVWTTVWRGCAGLLLSLLAAIGTAVLLRRSEAMQLLFAPYFALMRSVPIISFILLALIFLNPDGIPLLIAFLTMYPLLTENLLKGLLQLKPEQTILARQFHLNRRNRLFQIYYPQLKPYLFSGLASAVGFGWRAIIMGEVLAQCAEGIGSEMKRAQLFIAVPELMAWTCIAILLSWLSDRLLRRLSKWQPALVYRRATLTPPPPTTLSAPIRLRDLSYRYGVTHFDALFEAGKVYALTAPSGTGKTTLLSLLNGTLRPTGGRIENAPERIANVFQEPELLPHLSAKENILLAGTSSLSREEAERQADRLLAAMELTGQRNALPQEMSYGQQQRVALARALLFPSPLLLMDEPFKGLDAALRHRIIGFIRQWQQAHRTTILFASHQPEEIAEMDALPLSLPPA